MVQPDPSSDASRPRPSRTEPPVQSLEDRLLFRQAQGVLAGLTDCGHAAAARSLRMAAAELHLDVAVLAERFLGCLAHSGAEPAKDLLLRVAVLALTSDGTAPARPPGGRDVTSAAEPAVRGGATELAAVAPVVPFPGGVSVHGVLDAATVPRLHALANPLSVAGTAGSGDGVGFRLDLAGLTHLDGEGVRALDALATRIRDGGSTLRVTAPRSAGLRRLLRFAVSMRWLPTAFEEEYPASTRSAGLPGARPAGWAPVPGHDAELGGLDELYDRYASACWSLARRLLADVGHAEAVVQAAFLDVWEQLSSGTLPAGRAGARLLHRTHEEAVHRLREARTGPRPPTGTTDRERPGPLDRRHAPRRSPSDPRAELSKLPEHQAGPLRLAFWNGLTVQEIAATTGAPLADVRRNLLVGVRTLSRAGDHRPGDGDPGEQEADAH